MNQVDLKGRIAVITGGARGIGYAIAERVLRSGGSVDSGYMAFKVNLDLQNLMTKAVKA